MSPSFPFPLVMLVRILSICLMPSRQGTHLPHDSSVRNSMKYLATSTMQVSSSMTIMPPEPIIEPALVSSSKPTGRSRSVLREAAARRSACLDRLELLAARDAAAYLVR